MYDRKPNCSYNCLIGMALKSSESGRLPVGEIYRFFEREFPYFLTAAEPWKNSLRHSLSLGHYFRKYNSDKLVTKKGHLWEVDPQRAAELDKEMYMFLAKGLPENTPTSPQLSKLRLQMTQLLLDSIKHTPGSVPCHSAPHPAPPPAMLAGMPLGYTQPAPTNAQAFKRHDIVMLAQPVGAPFCGSSLQKPQRSPLYPNSRSTPAGSPAASPAAIHRRSAVGCLLASPSPRSKLPHPPISPASTPGKAAGSGRDPKRKTPSNGTAEERLERRRNSSAAFKSPRSQSTNSSLLCEEAYQLVQFCNHCSEMENRNQTDAADMETGSPDLSCQCDGDGLSTPISQGTTPLKPNGSAAGPTSNSAAALFCPDEEDPHYPFIVPPTNDRDVSLSQLNHATYHCHLGPPKELTVTKCKPRTSRGGDLCRACREMDEAVRPVVYDWNGWWEAEHVLCTLNEESYTNCVECRSEEDIRGLLSKNSRRIRQALLRPPAKPLDSSYVTPIKHPIPSVMAASEPTRRSQCGPRNGQRWRKKLKLQRQSSVRDGSGEAPADTRSRARSGGCKAASVKDAGDSASTKSLVSDACKSLKLIVSIPFRKLITERQMKKYCGEGGKHRIPTH